MSRVDEKDFEEQSFGLDDDEGSAAGSFSSSSSSSSSATGERVPTDVAAAYMRPSVVARQALDSKKGLPTKVSDAYVQSEKEKLRVHILAQSQTVTLERLDAVQEETTRLRETIVQTAPAFQPLLDFVDQVIVYTQGKSAHIRPDIETEITPPLQCAVTGLSTDTRLIVNDTISILLFPDIVGLIDQVYMALGGYASLVETLRTFLAGDQTGFCVACTHDYAAYCAARDTMLEKFNMQK